MYFEVHVVATEFRRKILATAAPHFSGFFLDCRAQKDSNERATKEEFNKMKSLMGTRDLLVAATCGQSAAGGREE
jgi:hypothetical protein